jgi:hypothetical protein
MKTFKSKIGPEFVIPIALVLGFVLVMGLANGPKWPAVAISATLFSLLAYLFATTRYEVHGDELNIRIGHFYMKKIDIQTIRKIKPSRNPLSSAATSIDRLEIRHGKFGFELISPKDKTGFVQALREINPEIIVEGIN